MKKKYHILNIGRLCLILLTLLLSSGCIKKIAMKAVAGALSSDGGTVFTGDNDPQLIADALPFALKTYESILAGLPKDQKLLIATGKSFCMYAFAFIQTPSDTISDNNIEIKIAEQKRAKKMFIRAREYLFRVWDIRYPQFLPLLKDGKLKEAMQLTEPKDSTLLYWTAGSWMGAFIAEKFDMEIAVTTDRPLAMMLRLNDMNPSFGNGAVHDYLISYYGGMPADLGGSEDKARNHFQKSLELSKGLSAGPYVALATSVCVKKQDHDEFKTLLTKAIAIDVNIEPSMRLANILSQQRATWLLNNISIFFLLDESENTTNSFEGDFAK